MSGHAHIVISEVRGSDAEVEIRCASQEDADALGKWILEAVKKACPDTRDIQMLSGTNLTIVKRMKCSPGAFMGGITNLEA